MRGPLFFLILSYGVLAKGSSGVLWSEGYRVGEAASRRNPYSFSNIDYEQKRLKGLRHALDYPVTSTRLVIPEKSLRFALSLGELKIPGFPSFPDMEGFFESLGLVPYPEDSDGRFGVSRPVGIDEDFYMGISATDSEIGPGITSSCLGCHASNFFGKSVVGLPSKASRAIEAFVLESVVDPLIQVTPFLDEILTLRASKKSFSRIRAHSPLVLGLDTSFSHVSRSLATRASDEWASFSPHRESFPAKVHLDTHRADSKIGTWWTVKYKNKWLSDGSIVSGNPIFTNILWNEIGRGADLRTLYKWITENPGVIEELTTFVFSTESPRWTDFLPSSTLNLASAMRGEKLFQQNCQRCHGTYEKAWSQDLSAADPFQTIRVRYHEDTPVINVGTDENRYNGMTDLALRLNDLAISKSLGIRAVHQKGYVPPPLDGIWARYPYFHNNSAPTLCDVLSPENERVRSYYQGTTTEISRDFDQDCVGFPTGENIPEFWKRDPHRFYDTRLEGLSNNGHSRMLYKRDGTLRYSSRDKQDLIEFLKTL